MMNLDGKLEKMLEGWSSEYIGMILGF